MGFSLRRMLRHPFGKHSVFNKATQIATILPLPGMGLLNAAQRLANRGDRAVAQLRGAFGVVSSSAQNLPSPSAMPGGARVAGSPPVHLAHKRKASRGRSLRRTKAKGRKRRPHR